jgi:hypothetical protein
MRAHAADQRQAAEPAVLHRKIDDGDTASIAAVEPVAASDASGMHSTLKFSSIRRQPAARSDGRR